MGKLLGRDPAEEIEYPVSDGKPMAETDVHRDAMFDLIERLKARYSGRDDVYVSGNLLVYYAEGKPKLCLAPDCFVAFGVPNHQRRTFKTWAEGTFPAVVFEVTSESTELEDTQTKFHTYQDVWKVRELFYFDPTGDYLPERLAGYRLSRGKFKPLTPTAGRLTSTELGITLEAVGQGLILREAKTGRELLLAGEQEARAARRKLAKQRKDAAALEAEIEQLKAELAALKRTPPAN
jgi:Uma2 family endonuclease